jgi:hypothetical protein
LSSSFSLILDNQIPRRKWLKTKKHIYFSRSANKIWHVNYTLSHSSRSLQNRNSLDGVARDDPLGTPHMHWVVKGPCWHQIGGSEISMGHVCTRRPVSGAPRWRTRSITIHLQLLTQKKYTIDSTQFTICLLGWQ